MKTTHIAILACLLASQLCQAQEAGENAVPNQGEILTSMCLTKEARPGSGLWEVDNDLRWDQFATLKVAFIDGPKNWQDKVLGIAAEWSKYCNITFARAEEDANIRVSFAGKGYWSTIGRLAVAKKKPSATMNLGFHSGVSDREFRRVVLHEFGHALGFGHEHQSPSAHIDWNVAAVKQFFSGPPNNWNDSEIENNVLRQSVKQSSLATAFDPKSVMLYPVPRQLTLNGFSSSWNDVLSEQDKQFVQRVYPKN